MGSKTDLLHECSTAAPVLRSVSSPGEALLAEAWSETKCWQRLLVAKPTLPKGKELTEFTWRLGPKLMSQNRKCECIVEWERRNGNRRCKAEFMEMEGKVFQGVKKRT